MRKKSIAISFIQRQTREERDDSLGAGSRAGAELSLPRTTPWEAWCQLAGLSVTMCQNRNEEDADGLFS